MVESGKRGLQTAKDGSIVLDVGTGVVKRQPRESVAK